MYATYMKLSNKIIAFLLIFIVGLAQIVGAQEKLSLLDEEIKRLNSQNIDTLVEYYKLPDIEYKNDTCPFYRVEYLFWKKGTKSYIEYFIDCSSENDKTIKSGPYARENIWLFSYLTENFSNLKNDEVLPFIYKDTSNNLTTYQVLKSSFHSQSKVFIIHTKTETIHKEIESKDLRECKLPQNSAT